jgi:thioredoxin 1
MSEPVILTDSNLDSILDGQKPVLILFSNGEGVRGEFTAAFKKAAGEHPEIIFAKVDSAANGRAAQRFDVGSKPVLIGWYNDSEVVRRNRPWGSDVPLAVEELQKLVAAQAPIPSESTIQTKEEQSVTEQPTPQPADDKPVHVTDATFQEEVIDYDKPVVIDFWAEWCGPCRMVAPSLEKLAKEFAGQVRIAKVDVDHNPGLQQAFRIMSIPTIMLIKQRTIVFSQPGALPEPALRDLIQQLIKLEVPPQEQEQPEEQPAK